MMTETTPDQVRMRANGIMEEKMLNFILTVKKYTAPWAVEEVTHPEVFRKAMLNIHEDACKVLKETGYAE